MTKTTHTAAFKKKVVLEALKEGKTLAQIASQFGIHPVQVCKWKKMLLDSAEAVFSDPRKARPSETWQQEAYERKVGQMAIELDYLKKNWGDQAKGEKDMDREKRSKSLSCESMRSNRAVKIKLLLSAHTRRCDDTAPYETSRRDLYSPSSLWFPQSYSGFAKRGTLRESETNARDYAGTGTGGAATWSVHIKRPSRAPQVSVLAQRPANRQTFTRMEYRYHIHPAPGRLRIFDSSHRLVQSYGVVESTIKQSRWLLLHRGFRGSPRNLWLPRDLQYRSRCAVHQRGIYESNLGQRDSIQHGWAWASLGQHFCRTPLEIAKI